MRIRGTLVAAAAAAVALTACGSSNTGRSITHPASTTAAGATPAVGGPEQCADGLSDIESPIRDVLESATATTVDADLATAARALQSNPLARPSTVRAAGEDYLEAARSYVQLVRSLSTPSPTDEQETVGGPIYRARLAVTSAQSTFETACATAADSGQS